MGQIQITRNSPETMNSKEFRKIEWTIKKKLFFSGSELFDCPDGDEIQESVENEKVEDDKVVQNEEKTENKKSDTVSPTEYVPLANQCDDLVVNSDAQFIDELGILMTKHETSKYLTPFMSQIRKTQEKARRNIKRRIDEKKKLQQPGKGGLILENIFNFQKIC